LAMELAAGDAGLETKQPGELEQLWATAKVAEGKTD